MYILCEEERTFPTPESPINTNLKRASYPALSSKSISHTRTVEGAGFCVCKECGRVNNQDEDPTNLTTQRKEPPHNRNSLMSTAAASAEEPIKLHVIVNNNNRMRNKRGHYQCQHCNVSFINFPPFYRHQKTHNQQVFPCKYCTMQFEEPLYLKIHQRRFHAEHNL